MRIAQRARRLVVESLERRELLTSITTELPVVGEFFQTTWPYLTLSGEADQPETQSVRINGRLTTVDDGEDHWSFTGVAAAPQVILPRGSTWAYLADGSDLGTNWRATSYDDAAWLTGAAPLGYGQAGVATSVPFGPDPQSKYVTTYARTSFELDATEPLVQLVVRLRYDDGVAIYLNGQEVIRTPTLPDSATYETYATSETPDPQSYYEFVIDPQDMHLLDAGTNTLAAEVHTSAPADDDLLFDLELAVVVPEDTDDPLRLHPGINRVFVQEYADATGAGTVLQSDFVDVWYDVPDEAPVELGGTLIGDAVLAPESGPYHVTNDLVVDAGSRLTILPGTSLYFDEGVELAVHGILDAQGTEFERIRFTSVPNAPFVPDRPNGRSGLPDGPPRWLGVHLADTMSPENVIAYADIEYAQSAAGSIGAASSEIRVDHVTWKGTHLRMFNADDASYEISNSTFPDMFAPDESPRAIGLDNVSEHVKTTGNIPQDGHAIIRNNVFGTNKGHNDVIDAVSGRRPDPILEVRDNIFLGAGDEGLDLGGDVYVEGNLFMDIGRDDDNRGSLYSNAISTGDASGTTPTVVLARNIFWNVDHVIHLRSGDAAIAENNTIVGIPDDYVDISGRTNITSAFHLYVAGDSDGAGAFLADNIFWELPRVFGNPDQPAGVVSQLEVTHNLLDPRVADNVIADRAVMLRELGADNVVGDPGFTDLEVGNFELSPTSPGKGAGRFGQDVGALVRPGIWVTGEPDAYTRDTTATLTVGGPGIFGFQYRIDGGPWSDPEIYGTRFNALGPTPRSATIVLDGLAPGPHYIEAIGQDYAGQWQVTPTLSRTWVISSSVPGDLDASGVVTAADIDLLFQMLDESTNDPYFDLNEDGSVDSLDVNTLVETIIGTRFGDANLDGIVDAVDFALWDANRFQVDNTTHWSTGDFNGDGMTDGSDFNLWNQHKFLANPGGAAGANATAARAPRFPLRASQNLAERRVRAHSLVHQQATVQRRSESLPPLNSLLSDHSNTQTRLAARKRDSFDFC
ncbi:MAG: hypothetical protein KDA60_07815 [Planctomycetales bacterium]|nr:hypothetical protein [Planctomycetales bacterium]